MRNAKTAFWNAKSARRTDSGRHFRSQSGFRLLLLAAAVAVMVSGPSEAGAQTYWYDEEFDGQTPGAAVQGWEGYQVSGVAYNSISYRDSSCASVSMNALPDAAENNNISEGWVQSPEFQCDLSVCDTLEIRMADLTYQTNTAWNVVLLIKADVGENRQPYQAQLQQSTNGASGIFTYSLKNYSSLGKRTCRVRIITRLTDADQGVIVVDYIRLYTARPYRSGDFLQDGGKKRYADFWYEDFRGGQAEEHVAKWWDNADNASEMNASITYLGGTGAKVKKEAAVDPNATPVPSYKVNAPGVYWDPNQYPLVRVGLTEISPATRCIVVAMKIGKPNSEDDWPQCEIGQASQPGEWVFDVRNVSDWPWPQKSYLQMLCLQFYIVSDQPSGDYYNVSYVAMSREVTPAAFNNVVKTYATPNPFFPLRGQDTTIHFDAEDLTADYTIRIYNMKGQRVRELRHTSFWNGRNDSGAACEGGVYLYQVEQRSGIVSGQLTLIR